MHHKPFKTLSRAIVAFILIALMTCSLPGTAFPVRAAAGDITRVSVSSSEEQANGYSRDADISADGRFVVFWSGASNLVAGDTNEWEDLFVRDIQTGETTRISVSTSGTQADNGSYYPAISGDGRFVAFMSDATNLVSGDTNGFSDIFLRDRQTNTTTRVSVSSNGTQANDISDSYAAISRDGRFIAFNSDATNLVAGDTNNASDVFVRDCQTGVAERISLDSNEVQANGGSSNPSISADGRFVAFSSSATNLVSGDTNASPDIFIRDRVAGVTTRVSLNSSGLEADRGAHDPAISSDGRYVTFSSVATNLLDEEPYGYDHVYLHDRQTGATTLVSIQSDGYQMVGWSTMPDISSDGRYIAFEFDDRGDGMAFVAIYIHDRLTGITTRVSSPGGGSEDSSFGPAISANGSYVAFSSFNSRLVSNDTNGWNDVFRLELAVTSPTIKTYQSIGNYDGWVIETGENNETGVRVDERANTFFLGDANNDQQYRSILHFGTASLPNNAIITNVSLRIKKQSVVGTNPFTTHGNILVDVRKPYFGAAVELQPDDFQAPADRNAAGLMEYMSGALWYTATLDESAFPYINRAGTTQFRLRFALDDNDDNDQDYIKFFSGDAESADQPVLTIDYYLPATGSPLVTGIFRVDSDPSSAPNVHFTVAFSEPVTGVDVSDFTLATSGISSASINSITGSGDTYTVTVGTGTGNGTIRLDLVDNDSIIDESNNKLGGTGADNGSFNTGEDYSFTRSTFGDVPTTHMFWSYIEAFYRSGITTGCSQSPVLYCPDGMVTRAQMAVFLERGIHGSTYNPPAVGGSTGFGDVPINYWSAAWIKQLAAEGITGGCGNGNYCPENSVTRAQMAVFLLRSKYGVFYNPPAVGGNTGFDDVSPGYWAAAWIKQLVAEGITAGCGNGNYCPEAPVTRAQMAVFLVRAFNLP
jgi:S-layer family protein/WD40 repeat protein